MANKLPTKKIEDMWNAFQERQSNRYVAQTCEVSQLTVRRHRVKDRWDERMAKIKEKAEEKIDETIASFKAKTFKVNKAIMAEFIEQLRTHKDISVSDFEKTVKLSLHLVGEPDTNIAEKVPEEERKRRLNILVKELSRRKLI